MIHYHSDTNFTHERSLIFLRKLALCLVLLQFFFLSASEADNRCQSLLGKLVFYDMAKQVTPSQFLLKSVFLNANQEGLFKTKEWRLALMTNKIKNFYKAIETVFGVIENPVYYQSPKSINFNALRQLKLSEFGVAMEIVFKNRTVIDLGSGHPDYSPVVRGLSELLGAKAYSGIDKSIFFNSKRENEFNQNGFQSVYVRDEILKYLQNKSSPAGQKVFLIEGVEVKTGSKEDQKSYFQRLLEELEGATHSDDYLVVGAVVSHLSLGLPKLDRLSPSNYGFEQITYAVDYKQRWLLGQTEVPMTYTIWRRQ